MQLTDEQRAELEQRIAQYEVQRDQAFANGNAAAGAAMALRELLTHSTTENAMQAAQATIEAGG